jgi:hypothetical protein
MKLIASKFKSKCRRCEQVVSVGENVYWEKSKGVIHKSCYENNISAEPEQKVENKTKYLFLIMRTYMFLAPLTYGPVYLSRGMNDAINFCLAVPLVIAFITGRKPTDFRVRVKWSSRRGNEADLFVMFVLFGVALSFGITWLLKSF